MNKHRSLVDVLASDQKKLEFIHGKKAESQRAFGELGAERVVEQKQAGLADRSEVVGKAEGEPGEQSKEKKPVEIKQSSGKRPRAKNGGPLEREEEAKPTLTQAVVPVTTRFRQDTAEALRRASLERKLAGESPNTQQDIIERCVALWLKSNGYLSDLAGRRESEAQIKRGTIRGLEGQRRKQAEQRD